MSSSNSEWLLRLLNVRSTETVAAAALLAEAGELEIEGMHVRLAVEELVSVRMLEWVAGATAWAPGAVLRRLE